MDNTLLPLVFYVQIDENGNAVDGSYLTAQNIFYIMDRTWEFTLEDVLAKGFAPVIDSNKVFTNGDTDIDIYHGALTKNADGSFTQQWIETVISDYEKRQRFLERARHSLLFQSDWTQVADVQLTDEEKAAWRVYRQALRDLPSTINWANVRSSSDVVWPTKPGAAIPNPDAAVNPFLEE
jgi:hypothetical protein